MRWLRERGFWIEVRNWRPPRGSGAGEVDIVASRVGGGSYYRASEIWLFEVKSHGWDGRGEGRALVAPAQLVRQRAAAKVWSALRPGVRVRAGLLWVNAQGQGIQFLENPCYS